MMDKSILYQFEHFKLVDICSPDLHNFSSLNLPPSIINEMCRERGGGREGEESKRDQEGARWIVREREEERGSEILPLSSCWPNNVLVNIPRLRQLIDGFPDSYRNSLTTSVIQCMRGLDCIS